LEGKRKKTITSSERKGKKSPQQERGNSRAKGRRFSFLIQMGKGNKQKGKREGKGELLMRRKVKKKKKRGPYVLPNQKKRQKGKKEKKQT